MNKIKGALRYIKHLKQENNTPSIDIKLHTIEESLEKQLPTKVAIGNYDSEFDGYWLHCSKCNEIIGDLVDEDADGKYKYNIYVKFCSDCGQSIEQMYTEEDYKAWGIQQYITSN